MKKEKTTFDRLRLIIPNEYINIIKESEFTIGSKSGVITNATFEQNTPFYYKINQNYEKSTTILEFSGKSLMDDYPSLISNTNIYRCFENINKQGICLIDPLYAVDTALVIQCDVTCDVTSQYTIQDIYAKLSFKSNKRWSFQSVTSNRFAIVSTQTTNRLKTRFIVYDKNKEINGSQNKSFLSTVCNKEMQLEYFKDKIRYELNLNSVYQIRKYFNIDRSQKQGYPKLTDILYSSADPIDMFLSEALIRPDVLNQAQEKTNTKTLSGLEHLLLIAICGFDLNKIDRVIRDLYGSSRSIKRAMAPYVAIMNRLKTNCPNPESDPAFDDIRTRLQYMLTTAFDSRGQAPADLASLYHSRKTNKNDSWQKSITDEKLHLYDVRYIILPESSNPISA